MKCLSNAKLKKIIFDKRLIWSLLFLIVLSFGFFNKVIYNSGDYYKVFSAKELTTSALNFSFQNQSYLIDISPYENKAFDTSSGTQIAVGDLNNDGFEDFISLSRNGRRQLVSIEKNINGSRFSRDRKLEKIIWTYLSHSPFITALAIVDLDNDGWNDITFVNDSCVYFLKIINGEFHESNIQTICTDGDKRNVNLLDVNNDGYIDLYYSSYRKVLTNWNAINTSGSGESGGKNILLLNMQGKAFKDVTDMYGIGSKAISWTAAISDFNNDGYPDIMDINDFGYNDYFENDQGKRFIKKPQALEVNNRSYSMSGEVADFNNDGNFDVYVSNTNRPTLLLEQNLMLINDGKGNFINEARKNRTSACGFSWGAKAFEPNKDLESALFVVNSPNQSINPGERNSLYESSASVRNFIQSKYKSFTSKENFINSDKFPQENCLFYRVNNEYLNIAKAVGINDLMGGKGISEIDFDNDGVSDFLISNIDHAPILYRGLYNGQNQWIGFSLRGIKSNRNAIGSVIEIDYEKGRKIKQLYPTNGYQSQSTMRLLFGVPQGNNIRKIIVKWPSGIKQEIKNYEINKYNSIIENIND